MKLSKVQLEIGPLLDLASSKLANKSDEMSENLSKQYTSVFSVPMLAPALDLRSPKTIGKIKFSKEEDISAIDELRSYPAAGIDGFPAIYLKECKEALSLPLCTLEKMLQ